jgi:hypothetical protein
LKERLRIKSTAVDHSLFSARVSFFLTDRFFFTPLDRPHKMASLAFNGMLSGCPSWDAQSKKFRWCSVCASPANEYRLFDQRPALVGRNVWKSERFVGACRSLGFRHLCQKHAEEWPAERQVEGPYVLISDAPTRTISTERCAFRCDVDKCTRKDVSLRVWPGDAHYEILCPAHCEDGWPGEPDYAFARPLARLFIRSAPPSSPDAVSTEATGDEIKL